MDKKQKQQVAQRQSSRVPTQGQQVIQQVHQFQYQGQIPPPSLLRDFDEIVPGTSVKLIQWAEDETAHRRKMESQAQEANIASQRRQLEIAAYQSKATFRSDLLGQAAGLLVCLCCVIGAIWVGALGYTAVAVALCAIPTAAVVQAFRVSLLKRHGRGSNSQP